MKKVIFLLVAIMIAINLPAQTTTKTTTTNGGAKKTTTTTKKTTTTTKKATKQVKPVVQQESKVVVQAPMKKQNEVIYYQNSQSSDGSITTSSSKNVHIIGDISALTVPSLIIATAPVAVSNTTAVVENSVNPDLIGLYRIDKYCIGITEKTLLESKKFGASATCMKNRYLSEFDAGAQKFFNSNTSDFTGDCCPYVEYKLIRLYDNKEMNSVKGSNPSYKEGEIKFNFL